MNVLSCIRLVIHEFPRLRSDAFPNARLIKGVIVRHIKLEHSPVSLPPSSDLIISTKVAFAKYGLPLLRDCNILLKDLAFGIELYPFTKTM